mgnify:CR=1 FL=1
MKTFFMIKPDGVKRNLIGEIISRVEAKGFVISKLKMMQIDKELAEEHYKEHAEKPFYIWLQLVMLIDLLFTRWSLFWTMLLGL